MWRNYLVVGLRALMKNRTYAFINILGLAIGMAACLMILLFVRYEYSYDRFLPNVANSYELQSSYTSRETGQVDDMQMTAYIAGQRFKKDFPQVEKVVYALGGTPVILKDGQASTSDETILVDGPFFDIVQFPFVRGNPLTALAQPGTVALSEKEALKRFGSTNILGQTLTMVSRGRKTDYRITGIFKDIPKNSSFALSIVGRVDINSLFSDLPAFMDSWGWQSGWVFFKLKPGADPAAIQAQMPAWEKRNIPDSNVGGIRSNEGDDQDWKLVNLQDIHLGKAQRAGMTPGNDRRSVFTFAIIAVLILVMAIINFTNLATARANQRAREVALRKVLGATRPQLMMQFIGESLLISAIAMLIALTFVELAMPAFAAFLNADIAITYFGSGGIILPVLLLMIAVGVLSGIYPAVFLSRYQPAMVLKANKSATETAGAGRLRSALVVGQFAVSIGLIICTAVIYAQTVYARTADPGFKRDGVVQIDHYGRIRDAGRQHALVDEIKRVSGVQAAAPTAIGISTGNTSTRGFTVPGHTSLIGIGTYAVDPDFFDTMGIGLVAGRKLDRDRPVDDATTPTPEDATAEAVLARRGVNVVVNELAVHRLGFANAKAAIGQTVRTSMTDDKYGLTPITIVGVVKDTRFRSLHVPLEPIMYYRQDNGYDVLDVRYSGDPAKIREAIGRVWQRLVPEIPYEAKFSEEIVLDLYKAEDARAKTFAGFAGLAVIVACLGLFGLAAFTAERRTKEIGIRKVLGAHTGDIVRLLVWQFSKPVLIANLIAWPAAWWVMRDWLNGFESQIPLSPLPFLASGLLALFIAISTISAHAVRVARENPIKALRYE